MPSGKPGQCGVMLVRGESRTQCTVPRVPKSGSPQPGGTRHCAQFTPNTRRLDVKLEELSQSARRLRIKIKSPQSHLVERMRMSNRREILPKSKLWIILVKTSACKMSLPG